ncbi:type I-E CRISPR-associated protein Cas6/Cse3/CasE [Streptomyces sp. TRM 70351]|uniref:type I-E CRISPR-associated protein Cas6/Cse3/CasE n=1 Tax=Streptomyces sp. TRM 70351 TaxID=3116552 RepID=UPI002E7B637B|nr:type I-E CRISPR-associated protein Cas6/Cse3/CasE [Streptomyces sp. TRM 70351]MEE1931291.1 type I-E CRISPR-associated protein Cas6/Cse3/CasE [Streptomyces sp. TRM 70351]
MTSPSARLVTIHSVLTLDAQHSFTAKALIDAHHMHRTVMSGFYGWVPDGDPTARSQMGVLSTWTVDLKTNTLVLVVQSRVPGDWTRIPRSALVAAPQTINVDRAIQPGDTFSFRTVVNPARSRPSRKPPSEKVRGRLVPHTTPEHSKQWFLKRLQPDGEPNTGPAGIARIGANTDSEALSVRMLPTISSSGPHKGLRITRAEMKGKLTVTDPSTLVTTLTNGIGHARAYGCGLILIRT